MAEAVKGTRRAYSLGNLMLYVQPLTKPTNGSTHASGLNNVVGYWANVTNESASTVKAGCDISNSGGTFTINLAEDSRNLDLYILSAELE